MPRSTTRSNLLFDQGTLDVRQHVRTSVTRLCLFHVILTLAKWTELYDHYKDVIPSTVKDAAKQLHKDLLARGIVAFRNKVVGHVWDKEHHRALTNAEIGERLAAITGTGVRDFLKWAGDPDAMTDAHRPLVVIEAVRDAISATYHLTDADLHR